MEPRRAKSVASWICGEIGDRGGGLILSGIGGGGVGEIAGRVIVGFRCGIGGRGGDGGGASLFGGRFGGTVGERWTLVGH